jgi:hypothetical protein
VDKERGKMKKILFIIILLFVASLFFSEISIQNDPKKLIYRKEVVSSWIPFLNKYFLYDKDGNRYKVNKNIFDAYWLWSENERIYASDEVAERINIAFKAELLSREEALMKRREDQKLIDDAKNAFVDAFDNSKFAKKYQLYFTYLKREKSCDTRCYCAFKKEDWDKLTEEITEGAVKK